MITMSEIAKMTHVSQPTVSRVLNGSQTVDPSIRERVLACAQAHDYQPSALARGLRGSKTNLLGVLLTDITNNFFADLAREIEAKARERGYSLILFNTDLDPRKQRDYIDVLRRYRVDGVLMVPIWNDLTVLRECIGKLSVPTVMITWRVEGFDSVYLDHEEAAGQAARHLAERNYRRFLFVGERADVKYIGFARELEGMGLCPAREVDCIECEDDGELKRALQAQFCGPGLRTGIFVNTDLWALRVMRTLRELGVRVPEDAGVIGFDNISMDRYLRPSLSSISQPTARMAGEAVARLLYRIDHPEEPELLDLPLRAALVPREST